MTVSKWEKFDLESRIRGILRQVKETQSEEKDHSFDPPFISAYQLAIALYEDDAKICERMGMELGGKGGGTAESLSRYIANQLSRRIKDEKIDDIEGAFLSLKHVDEFKFDYDVVASSHDTFSLFRLK